MRTNRQNQEHEQEYSLFACPYRCGVPVKIPSANVSNNKSNQCRAHLLLCEGVAEDGRRAQADPRLLGSSAFKKRALEGAASVPVVDTVALTERCETLVAEKAMLAEEKATLQSRVFDLETLRDTLAAQFEADNLRYAQLQAQMTASNQRVSKLEAHAARQEKDLCAIAGKLGFSMTPPVPDVGLLIRSIDTLKAPPRTMAAAPQARTRVPLHESHALNPRIAELEDELLTVQEELRKAKKRVAKLSQTLANVGEQIAQDRRRADEQIAQDRRRADEQAEKNRKLLAKVRRDIQFRCHPDRCQQYRDTEHMATELSKIVNELVV